MRVETSHNVSHKLPLHVGEVLAQGDNGIVSGNMSHERVREVTRERKNGREFEFLLG
jgi:hypothetical protein